MTIANPPRDPLAAALWSNNPKESLRNVAREMLATGVSRRDVLSQLEELRSELRADHREEEDFVLDVMDDVSGWTSPHRRL